MVAKMELASAYVTLNVSTAQMGKQIGRMFGQAESQASTTGKRMGKSIQKGLDSASSSTVEDLQKRLTTGEEKLAAATERGSKRRSAAARGVEIAEAKLNEVKEKGNAKNSQIMAAEDRLIKAREKYAQVSRDAVTQISGYAKEVQASRAALDELSATSTRSGGAIRKAFAGIGSTIGQSFTGATSIASSAMTGIRTAAAVAASAVKSTFAGVGSFLKNVFTGNFSGAFNQIVTGAKTAGSAVSTAFSNVWGGFTNGIANARSSIASTSQNMVSSFSGAASRTGEAVRGGLSRGFEGIRAVASRSAAENFAAFTSGAGRAASTVGNALSSGFRSTASAAWGAASNGFSAFTSGVGRAASAIGSGISGAFRSTVSVASSAARNGASALANGFSRAHRAITSGFGNAMSGISSLAGRTGSSAGSQLSSGIMSWVTKLPAMVGAVVGTGGLMGILMGGFNRLADIQEAEVLFKNNGLDVKTTKTEMDKLNKAVTGTKVSLSDAAKQASMFMNSGVKYGPELDESVKALTNMATVAPDGAKGVGLVMNQIKALGKLQAQDAKQLTERQIPIWTWLSKTMGKPVEEIRKLSEDGKISFEDMTKAVNENSKTLAQDMGGTIRSMFTNLKNAFDKLGAAILGPFMEPMKKWAENLYNSIQKKAIPAIEGFYKWLGSGSKSAEQFKNAMVAIGTAIAGVAGALTGMWVASKLLQGIGTIISVFGSPFALLVVTIAAVAGAIALAYKKVGWFKDLVDNFFWRIKLGVGLFKDAWNNADKDVSASGIPGFFQGLGKLARTVLDSVVDLVKKVAKSFWDYFGPALEDIGPKFKDAFKNAGKVLGDIAEAVKKVGKFLGDTADYWVPFATGIGLVAGAIVAYNVVAGIAAGISTVWAGAMAIITSPITLIIIGLGLLIGAIIWAYKNIDWFRNMVDTAWAWIKDATANFVQWWTETAWPAIVDFVKRLGDWFVWLWQEIIVPAWDNISKAVGAFLDWWTQTFWPGVMAVGGFLNDMFWGIWGVVSGVWNGIWGVISGFLDWWTQTFWPGVMNVGEFLKGVFMGLWGVVQTVWNGIQAVISWAWNSVIKPIWDAINWVINAILVPVFNWLGGVISAVWNGIVAVISWAWNSIILPLWNAINGFINAILVPVFNWLKSVVSAVWNGIVAVIQWAWNNIILPIWNAINAFINTVLVPVFNWLRSVIVAVWNGIVGAIQWAWNVMIRPAWDAIKWFIENVLIPAFNFLRDRIKAAWDFIGNIIATTWNWLRDVIFTPLMNFIKNDLVAAWDHTADFIGKAWNKLRDAVKKPIEFVVDHAINPFLNAYNAVNDMWNGPDIGPLKVGWATGGYTGPGAKYDVAGVVHADEYVVNKAARKKFEQKYPGYLDSINTTGDLPNTPKNAPAKGGQGIAAGVPHGPGTNVWGAMQAEASRSGKMYFKDTSLMGASVREAAKAWMGRSALDVKVGSGSPGVSSFVNGNSGGWGYYSGNQIQMSSAVPANRRGGVLVHEIGHALGLDHVAPGDSSSVMDHMMTGGDWPHAKDYAALADTWGQPGKGVKTYENPGGTGGGSSWIVDLVSEKIKSIFNKMADKAKDMFKGNSFVEVGVGTGQAGVNGIIDWLTQMFGGGGSNDQGGEASKPAEQWRGTVIDALKRVGLPTSADYVNAWIRQIQTESGGNPNAVQGNIGDVNNASGDIAKGLVQVIGSTFAAYRDPSLPNDRLNPLASLVAGMRYAKARYGSSGMLGAIGHGHGYANGGLVTPAQLFDGGGKLEKGVQFIDHQRDKPDYVLTHEQWAAMYSIAENTSKDRGGDTWNLYGPDADEVSRRVIEKQKRREALYA